LVDNVEPTEHGIKPHGVCVCLSVWVVIVEGEGGRRRTVQERPTDLR
jgi:hypothetical protein